MGSKITEDSFKVKRPGPFISLLEGDWFEDVRGTLVFVRSKDVGLGSLAYGDLHSLHAFTLYPAYYLGIAALFVLMWIMALVVVL